MRTTAPAWRCPPARRQAPAATRARGRGAAGSALRHLAICGASMPGEQEQPGPASADRRRSGEE
eukprot:14215522-Alexandrium_andersonii.AAC.1